MSNCKKCGYELADKVMFCGNCGAPTDNEPPENTPRVRVPSAFAYAGFLFFLPLAICPKSKLGRFHANQGLVLFIFNIIVSTIMCTAFVFFMVSMKTIRNYQEHFQSALNSSMTVTCTVAGIVFYVFDIILIILGIFQIIGIVSGARGKRKKLPLIGKIKILK